MDFLEHWNEVILFQIQESDLVNPTEKFVFKAVISVLKLLHIDVMDYENMYNEPENLNSKRVLLVNTVNYFYQGHGYRFYYMDLVKPSAKRTQHVLNSLLNYFAYVDMIKQDVLALANQPIQNFQALSSKINKIKLERESNKLHEQKLSNNIENLHCKIPQLQDNIAALKGKEKQYTEEVASTQKNIKDLEEKTMKLTRNMDELKMRVIPDSLADDLMEKLKSTEVEEEEYKIIEIAAQQNSVDHSAQIAILTPLIQKMETLLKFSDILDGSIRNLKQSVTDLKQSNVTFNIDLAKKKEDIHNINIKIASVEHYLGDKQVELDTLQKESKKQENITNKLLADEEKLLLQLTEQHKYYSTVLSNFRNEFEAIIETCVQAKDKVLGRE